MKMHSYLVVNRSLALDVASGGQCAYLVVYERTPLVDFPLLCIMLALFSPAYVHVYVRKCIFFYVVLLFVLRYTLCRHRKRAAQSGTVCRVGHGYCG